jgi:alkanesulfonate monooxygenase SsuD/methylene tetrahydromethanopterin reductase-like flavin-dependent oxidoreductase (luciferase family)
MGDVRVGLFPTVAPLTGPAAGEELRTVLALAAEVGVDHLCVGDHVSFFVGAGSDGLTTATWLLAAQDDLPVYVALYLLPLRHPVPVARQLATLAQLAPGRLTLGVGIGGEDPHEVEICGVDPKTRGRRMDESLQILRGLGEGTPVTLDGEFFSLHEALILPAPSPPVPLIVGGRSDAAVRRAAKLGDGWLGIWVSARRFAEATAQAAEAAADRPDWPARHVMQVWCGIADSKEDARACLAPAMEGFYGLPFERFERYSPYGSAEDVAEFLQPYVDAGCAEFNLITQSPDEDTRIEATAAVKRLLT